MSLSIPVTTRLRRRPKAPKPYEAHMVHTQHIRFTGDQLRALQADVDEMTGQFGPDKLGNDIDLHGSIIGRPVVAKIRTARRVENRGTWSQGHWQDNILQSLDASAKAMIQLQLPEYVGTWEWYGPEYVLADIRIVYPDAVPVESSEPVKPATRNRLRR